MNEKTTSDFPLNTHIERYEHHKARMLSNQRSADTADKHGDKSLAHDLREAMNMHDEMAAGHARCFMEGQIKMRGDTQEKLDLCEKVSDLLNDDDGVWDSLCDKLNYAVESDAKMSQLSHGLCLSICVDWDEDAYTTGLQNEADEAAFADTGIRP